jgi:phosphoribosylglycinamide formyltransferase 1
MTARIAVLLSGSGSNLQAILDACADGRIDAIVVAVVSDRDDAFGLERARQNGVSMVLHHTRRSGPMSVDERRMWDASLADVVTAAQPDWVVLAGFLRILSSAFLERFANRVVNLHPARPGELAGLHAIERAFDEHVAGFRSSSGVMVHLVPDEGVDDGPVLATVDVPFVDGDTLATFSDRMHRCEHDLLVATLADLVGCHAELPARTSPLRTEEISCT